MVLGQGIDAAAIDSTVLDQELQNRTHLKKELRVIETLGPSPMPPWVVTTNLPAELRRALRQVFWQMHQTAAGQVFTAGQLPQRVPLLQVVERASSHRANLPP